MSRAKIALTFEFHITLISILFKNNIRTFSQCGQTPGPWVIFDSSWSRVPGRLPRLGGVWPSFSETLPPSSDPRGRCTAFFMWAVMPHFFAWVKSQLSISHFHGLDVAWFISTCSRSFWKCWKKGRKSACFNMKLKIHKKYWSNLLRKVFKKSIVR